MTRELEVWGIVEGQVVNGIIDELSYQNPDVGAEEKGATVIHGGGGVTSQQRTKGRKRKKQRETDDGEKVATVASQKKMHDYLSPATTNGKANEKGNAEGRTFSQIGTSIEDRMRAATDATPKPCQWEEEEEQRELTAAKPYIRKQQQQDPEELPKIYLTDVKTRTAKSLPSALAFRPTEMQLQLYYWMVESMARGQVPLQVLLDRYDLDGDAVFSDTFIAQVGTLDDEWFDEDGEEEESTTRREATVSADTIPSSQPSSSLAVLLRHNNLHRLWGLMLQQFRRTFFSFSSDPHSAATNTAAEPLPHQCHPPHPESEPKSEAEAEPTFLLSPILTALYVHPPPPPAAAASPSSSSSSQEPSPTSSSSNASNHNKNTNNSSSCSSSTTRGVVLGTKSIQYSRQQLSSYLRDQLDWWMGRRRVRGVNGGNSQIDIIHHHHHHIININININNNNNNNLSSLSSSPTTTTTLLAEEVGMKCSRCEFRNRDSEPEPGPGPGPEPREAAGGGGGGCWWINGLERLMLFEQQKKKKKNNSD